MKICKLYDCTKAANKCKQCEYQEVCDYPWVMALWDRNSKLLSPNMPGFVKDMLKNEQLISCTGEADFCVFTVPKNKDYVTINDICVGESLRGKGTAKAIINFLMEKYDRDALTKCIKDSSAEAFWKHNAVKLYEHPSTKSTVCVYRIKNENKKLYKEELF